MQVIGASKWPIIYKSHHHLIALIPFYLGSKRNAHSSFFLPFSHIRCHTIIFSFFIHIISYTVHPSFLWPSPSSPSINIHTHHSLRHMSLIPPHHMFIPRQTISFHFFRNRC
ncbi:unnamed protein product [Chrysodeixis includens]|uniref:Uncharacterized protein n=1 Tax=Chrysodeixis includens TaxID=689277 RepID=A0A9N8L2I1_CHRIL|nr:unnamed protein product [Chrysodeixis includens]